MNKVNNKSEEFDALKWIRKVRDTNYEKYKHLSTKEYIELINKKAQKFVKNKKSGKKVS